MMVLLNGLRRITGQGISRRIVSSGCLRRAGERCRRVLAVMTGLLVAAGSSLVSVPAALTAAAVAAGGAAAMVTAVPAKATGGLPVLVVDVNGEPSAAEAALLTTAGYTVTQVTTSALGSMSKATFQGYAAVVIGDPPSGGSCQVDTTHLGTNWEGWVTGNVAVLGTDAGLAASLATGGNTAAATLITDTAAYAAAQPGSSVTQTGLYLSLEGCYAGAAHGTDVSLLDSVADPGQVATSGAGAATIGAAGGIRVNGGLSCADSGTVNKWEASAAGTYSGFTSASLASGSPGWPSPGCAVPPRRQRQ
jgi:hypothetical protein